MSLGSTYQTPVSFHQATPTVPHTARFHSETWNPTLHHWLKLTWFWEKYIGAGEVP